MALATFLGLPPPVVLDSLAFSGAGRFVPVVAVVFPTVGNRGGRGPVAVG